MSMLKCIIFFKSYSKILFIFCLARRESAILIYTIPIKAFIIPLIYMNAGENGASNTLEEQMRLRSPRRFLKIKKLYCATKNFTRQYSQLRLQK